MPRWPSTPSSDEILISSCGCHTSQLSPRLKLLYILLVPLHRFVSCVTIAVVWLAHTAALKPCSSASSIGHSALLYNTPATHPVTCTAPENSNPGQARPQNLQSVVCHSRCVAATFPFRSQLALPLRFGLVCAFVFRPRPCPVTPLRRASPDLEFSLPLADATCAAPLANSPFDRARRCDPGRQLAPPTAVSRVSTAAQPSFPFFRQRPIDSPYPPGKRSTVRLPSPRSTVAGFLATPYAPGVHVPPRMAHDGQIAHTPCTGTTGFGSPQPKTRTFCPAVSFIEFPCCRPAVRCSQSEESAARTRAMWIKPSRQSAPRAQACTSPGTRPLDSPARAVEAMAGCSHTNSPSVLAASIYVANMATSILKGGCCLF